ncbi:MATE family efflux transporter [Limibacillus sp. MBR-115]|jgi:MATE family multidrug resistance protein|uniref:MATE family efflux transporter n=1 Tax=Limibacillus sp. MBR-115 TaxID=3156465 RepID=UPI00339696F9
MFSGREPDNQFHQIGYNVRRTLTLSIPVTLSRAGTVAFITVDTVMVGQTGSEELAFYGLAFAPHMPLFVISLGLLSGVPVLIAQADGAGRFARCGPIWRTGLILATILGLITGIMTLFGQSFFTAIGQSAHLSAGGARVLEMFGYGMPGLLIFITTSFMLETIGRERFVTLVTFLANFLNFGLNWLLIEGNLGAPAMGAAGAALGTSITRWAMAAALLLFAFNLPEVGKYALRPGRGDPGGARFADLLRIGVPYSLAIGSETLAFSTVAMFAGLMGETSLAGYQAAMNVNALIFMVGLGLMVAASVRVGNAVGRGDRIGLALAGWTGMGLVLFCMLVISILLNLDLEWVAGLYTDDAAVMAVAASALSIIALYILIDGAQAVMLGALRGAGDVLFPTLFHFTSFWIVAVPLAWFLGLHQEMGVKGLFLGMSAGLMTAAILLSLRFHLVSRREIRAFVDR